MALFTLEGVYTCSSTRNRFFLFSPFPSFLLSLFFRAAVCVDSLWPVRMKMHETTGGVEGELGMRAVPVRRFRRQYADEVRLRGRRGVLHGVRQRDNQVGDAYQHRHKIVVSDRLID